MRASTFLILGLMAVAVGARADRKVFKLPSFVHGAAPAAPAVPPAPKVSPTEATAPALIPPPKGLECSEEFLLRASLTFLKTESFVNEELHYLNTDREKRQLIDSALSRVDGRMTRDFPFAGLYPTARPLGYRVSKDVDGKDFMTIQMKSQGRNDFESYQLTVYQVSEKEFELTWERLEKKSPFSKELVWKPVCKKSDLKAPEKQLAALANKDNQNFMWQ